MVYCLLSLASFCLAVFFLCLLDQPEADFRWRQMDLFCALFFEVLAAWLLCSPASSLYPLLSYIGYAAFWVVLALEFVLGLVWLKISSSIHFSLDSMASFQKPLSRLFFWIPEEQLESDDELTRLLEATKQPEMEEQRDILENALDLNETTLDEICTHRSDMVCLSMKDDPSKWKQIILANRHTFYPVTDESGDDIIGVLDTRDYFRLDGIGKKTILDKTVDKPLFAAENTTADELLHMMKQRRTYFAIVLDEYGGVVGLVTLHDIIEELFGELSEEEKRQADIVKLPKNVWRINGEADLDDVSKALGFDVHLDDFETFSGFILGSLGYIPEDGAQLETKIGPMNIQIRRIKGHRIRQTLVRLDAPDPSAPAQTAQAPQSLPASQTSRKAA